MSAVNVGKFAMDENPLRGVGGGCVVIMKVPSIDTRV